MQLEPDVLVVRILIQVVNPVGVEQGGPALDTVHFVAFGQQQFGEVGTVLSGDASDERASGSVHVQIYADNAGVQPSQALVLGS